MSTKVWFITGASSGFGRGITELALEKGDIAVATLRKPEMISDLAAKYTSKHLLVLKVDVLKPAEIRAAFDEAVKAYGRIDVVFNNAGYNVIGEVEATTDQIARAVFDVNFFGAVNVSKEAVRTFRDVNKPQGGRLIQMSSMVVHNDPAGYAFYAATKCALNAVSDALALEVDPEWNIKIIEVESGAFNTNVMQSTVRTEAHPAYSKPTLVGNQVRNLLAGTTSPPGTPTVFAAVKAVTSCLRPRILPDTCL